MSICFKRDPGPCPVDDAPHTTCTAPTGPIAIVQLPARDGVSEVPLVGAVQPPLTAEIIQQTLPPTATTTGTYRRKPELFKRKARGGSHA